MPPTEAALIVHLAKSLFQFGDEGGSALFCFGAVQRRSPGKLPVFHDLHFELNTLVCMSQTVILR
jgi:hypothetical protein